MKEATAKNNKFQKFKSFTETYPICAFGLASGLIYPNKYNIRKRVIYSLSILAVNFLELFWFCAYLIKCLQIGDLYNFMRNMSLAVIVTLFFFKSIYVNMKNNKFLGLLNEISQDLLKGNEMEKDYQVIYENYIKQAKIGEAIWVIIPFAFCAQFPLYASIGTIYESMKSDVGKRYMIQELDLKYAEHLQSETPYYEIIFVYNFIQIFIVAPNFVGFDGSFCIATTHLRMKLQLMVHKIQRSFTDTVNHSELREKIKEAIRDHQEALKFHNNIQEVYGGWLLTVFTLTSFLISFNLYMIYLVKRIEPRYAIFAFSGVMHMYAPCYFAASLLEMGEKLSTAIYCSPWEKYGDNMVTKLLIFIMARAQQPLILSGKGLVIYNMQLFVSILQTSYSVFTLITS